MSLRWRKEPHETGLRSVGQSPRGFELRDGEEVVCSVSPAGGGWRSPLRGWYWVGDGINTYNSKPLFKTKEDAKADADLHFKAKKGEK